MATCAADLPPTWDALVEAPGFALGLSCRAGAVSRIGLLEPCPARPGRTPLAAEAARQLAAWLADPRVHFDLPLAPRAPPSSTGSGSRSPPFPGAKAAATANSPKPSAAPPGPWAVPVAPTPCP